MTKVIPLRDKLVVRRLAAKARSSILEIPDAISVHGRAQVEAVGPDCKWVKAGAVVYANLALGQDTGIDEQILIPERAILAVEP